MLITTPERCARRSAKAEVTASVPNRFVSSSPRRVAVSESRTETPRAMPALFTTTLTSCAVSAARATEAGVGDVELQRDHAGVVGDDRLRVAGGGVDLRDAAVEELADEFTADAAVGAGDEDGLVDELSHVISPWVGARSGADVARAAGTGLFRRQRRCSQCPSAGRLVDLGFAGARG